MAKAYIEYCLISDQDGAKIPGKCIYAATANIDVAASTITDPLTKEQWMAGARILKMQNDGTACFFAVGSSPDPTATNPTITTSVRRYLSAGVVDYFPLAIGDCVSVIAVS